ncbi:transcriptional regulator TbsP [Halospeciosus flavus]|uniref:Transcriptional regulator TbsP n=1 Tax=Halospeciosus flavus TaxID=3032283 RepID=A0ABD5Z0K0_9EURY|nr:DUF5821 family protein [Halospeciosus flavus]
MEDTLLGTTVDDVLGELFDGDHEEIFVVNPTDETIERVVETAMDDEPRIRMLADERRLKDAMDDFLVASDTAELLEDGQLAMRTVEDASRSSLLVTEDETVALVDAGDHVGGIVASDADFADTAYDAVVEDWESADEFDLDTPALSRIRQALDDETGPEVEEDFETALASLETARGDGDSLDEVTISLLTAAKNRVLFYDISEWGEEVGVASKATFSRKKSSLEDVGLLETEKVPMDVGRPRLRLTLGDERLEGASMTEVVNTAESLLAS